MEIETYKIRCIDCDGIGNFVVVSASNNGGYYHDEELISCSSCRGTGIEEAYEL